jgi:hypothetical protein
MAPRMFATTELLERPRSERNAGIGILSKTCIPRIFQLPRQEPQEKCPQFELHSWHWSIPFFARFCFSWLSSHLLFMIILDSLMVACIFEAEQTLIEYSLFP